MSATFYTHLPILTELSQIVEPSNFYPAPADWWVALSDVRNSTQAINAGHYKAVNMAGAASIVALLNCAPAERIPFVFGGDGATLLIPPDLLEVARATLAGVRAMVQRELQLDLRVGFVPLAEVRAHGAEVAVARLRISAHYDQALLSGGGTALAERLIKDPTTASRYLLPADAPLREADMTGLECRWQDIPSPHGETVSLLVMAMPGMSPEAASAIYRQVIAEIEAAYGQEQDYHPLAVPNLHLSLKLRDLLGETKLRTPPRMLARWIYMAQIWALNMGVRLYTIGEVLRGKRPWWQDYREQVFRTADYKKYDDTLRMIIAGRPQQRQQLSAFLEHAYQQGQLVYGLHVTDRALMTCLVFERMGRQVHFVDGADGGYARAAVALKDRLKSC